MRHAVEVTQRTVPDVGGLGGVGARASGVDNTRKWKSGIIPQLSGKTETPQFIF